MCPLSGEDLARQRQRARSSFGDAKVLKLEMKSRLKLAKSRVEVEKKEVRGTGARPLWDIRGSHVNQHCSSQKDEAEKEDAEAEAEDQADEKRSRQQDKAGQDGG